MFYICGFEANRQRCFSARVSTLADAEKVMARMEKLAGRFGPMEVVEADNPPFPLVQGRYRRAVEKVV